MKYLSVSMIILACLTLLGCAGNNGNFPQAGNPPAFDYVDGEELRSGMHQLAFALQRLDDDLSGEYDDTPLFQQSVMDRLNKIESIGKSLRRGDISSKHEFLAEGMDKFLNDVQQAKWYVEKRRYYMAGRVAGACVSCHKANSY